jgi:hypothetical protein
MPNLYPKDAPKFKDWVQNPGTIVLMVVVSLLITSQSMYYLSNKSATNDCRSERKKIHRDYDSLLYKYFQVVNENQILLKQTQQQNIIYDSIARKKLNL